MKRTLTLRREALTALTPHELAAFGGAGEGDPDPTPPIFAPNTIPLGECLNSRAICTAGSCPC